ncbi:MAG: hypothetical protein HYX47_12805 [Burkholderiales bacterium]|nr:hypothetical protein [Burkholderiales bacterium]
MRDTVRSSAPAAAHRLLVRVGVPLVSGDLTLRCLATGLPLLFSANAFARNAADGSFGSFRLQAAERLPAGHDIALDSAGFVSSALYGDYRWSIDSYLDLVATRSWTFWASLDHTCEPEVAANAAVRRLRIDATVANFVRCANRAAQRGLSEPLFIIQGHTPDDYEYCIRTAPFTRWPPLVGIGSVCRRHAHGENGLLRVMERIDALLPEGTRCHLFGCKGTGLAALKPFWQRRIFSVDSMAWDVSARRAQPTGRTQEMRAAFMVQWHDKLQQRLADPQPLGAQVSLDLRRVDVFAVAGEAVGSAIADLYGSSDLDYRDCSALVSNDMAIVSCLLKSAGAAAFGAEDPEEDFGLGIVYGAVRQALIDAGELAAQ